MDRLLTVLCLCLALGEGAIADSHEKRNELNPVEVARAIAQDGEIAVMRSLRRDETKWTEFISSLSSGQQAWINIGLLFLPHADGVARTELRIAFEEALATSPYTTVGSISPLSPNLRVICGPSAHPTYDLAENSIDQRFNAVAAALARDSYDIDASLRARLHKCADMLQAAEEHLRQQQSEQPSPKR